MYFSRKLNPPDSLTLFGNEIPFFRKVKYLGVILDSRLTFANPVNHAIQKANIAASDIGSLLNANDLNICNKILLYKSIMRPIMLYAAPVWGCAANSTLKQLQKKQNKILHCIYRAPWYIRNTTIASNLKIDLINRKICKFVQYAQCAKRDNIYNP